MRYKSFIRTLTTYTEAKNDVLLSKFESMEGYITHTKYTTIQ